VELRAAVPTGVGATEREVTVNRRSFRIDLVCRALRCVPPGTPGKARLARLLLGSYLQTQNVLVQAHDGYIYLVPSLREPIGFYLLVDGMYEPSVVKFVLSQLHSGATFVDVGANIGVFTISAARKVGSTGRVLAIEPSPRVFPYLEHNVRGSGLSSIQLKRSAAYDRDADSIPFWEAPVDHFGMGALAPQFYAQPTLVGASTLDGMLTEAGAGEVDVLKVDVEGFEAAVFRGAEKLLTSPRAPLIVFEYCDWAEQRMPNTRTGDAQRVLLDYGYHIWRLSDFVHYGLPLENVLMTGFEMLIATRR
jgi:FkbM family methyltransferase